MVTKQETSRQIEEAVAILRAGGIVALPSETVYGLAASALNEEAVAKIFTAKGRPSFNPLICHMSGIEMARDYVKFNDRAEALAQAFWPGALTLVLPKISADIAPNVSAGLETLAVRTPAHPTFHEVIAKLGTPIAAPSANLSGRLSPTRAEHVERDLQSRVNLIVDGGATEHGLESTVVLVDETQVVLLRHGAIPKSAIEACLGEDISEATQDDASPKSPGQLLKHYAPRTRIVLNASPKDAGTRDFWVGFGDGTAYDLSPSGDLREAARVLFDRLSQLDEIADDDSVIYVAPIPNEGIGAAINDRLQRAAQSGD